MTTKSSDTDMVSEMDREAEALIVATFLRERPTDGILGEESGSRLGTSGVRWIIDPLDGTTNYLYGFPSYAVSIAAEVDGVVEVGIVADPSRHEIFTARRGGGAECNGEPIAVTGATDLARCLVGTGFSYLAERRANQASILTTVVPAVRDIRRVGAAALDLCWVACGRLDAYYEADLAIWDVAAGMLIASEAGALVVGLDGGGASAQSVLAASPLVAEPLRTLIHAAAQGPHRVDPVSA